MRQNEIGIDLDDLFRGDRRTLGKAITLIESSKSSDKIKKEALLKAALPHSQKSFRLGISGVPGVGKSTFIESFGLMLIEKGHRVAVLAIDPSSPLNGGSILGDKTRMEQLSQHQNAFIRPSPSQCFLGGVAQATRESIILCEAAGYDFIIVETVGVGQSETEVSSMVDFFMLLTLPNAGDEIQGIKKGILELAHAVVVNKADGKLELDAEIAKKQFENVLGLFHHPQDYSTKAFAVSSLTKKNLNELYSELADFKKFLGTDGLKKLRSEQHSKWFEKLILEIISQKITSDPKLIQSKNNFKAKIQNDELTALAAAENFCQLLLK